MSTNEKIDRPSDETVDFSEWEEVLAYIKEPRRRNSTKITVTWYLGWCRRHGLGASPRTAADFLKEVRQHHKPEEWAYNQWRDCLRWFFQMAARDWKRLPDPPNRKKAPPVRTIKEHSESHDPIDSIGSRWERELTTAIRRENLLLRTEQAYRGWLKRYLQWLGGGDPMEDCDKRVCGFLEHLAVSELVAYNTQRQALNALVFFYKKALNIELGKLNFQRARRGQRLPVVLSQSEVRHLLAHMQGTPALMAKLAYGGGLRVSELVRLRIKDIDLDRLQLHVRSGKGDKDRQTTLPNSAVPFLENHMEKLRALHDRDRKNDLPGVFLPGALDRKYPRAGTTLQWQWLFPTNNIQRDPRSGIQRRHHVSPGAFQQAISRATIAADITKRAIAFVRGNPLQGAGIVVEVSDDLSDWSPAAPEDYVEHSVTDNGDGTESVVVRLTAPLVIGQPKFIRLSVEAI
jgi:integron integrase